MPEPEKRRPELASPIPTEQPPGLPTAEEVAALTSDITEIIGANGQELLAKLQELPDEELERLKALIANLHERSGILLGIIVLIQATRDQVQTKEPTEAPDQPEEAEEPAKPSKRRKRPKEGKNVSHKLSDICLNALITIDPDEKTIVKIELLSATHKKRSLEPNQVQTEISASIFVKHSLNVNWPSTTDRKEFKEEIAKVEEKIRAKVQAKGYINSASGQPQPLRTVTIGQITASRAHGNPTNPDNKLYPKWVRVRTAFIEDLIAGLEATE